MALLQEIEDNFSNLKAYKLVNCQENFIVKFNHLDNNFELNINKDKEYIYLKSNNFNTDFINYQLIDNKDLTSIINLINKRQSPVKEIKKEYDDVFGLFRAREIFNKGQCDYDKILQELSNSTLTSSISIKSIPKSLLYTKKQISDMLVTELKSVNSCKDYPHFIVPSQEDFSFIMNIFIKSSNNSDIHVKLEISYDPDLYPFNPPQLKYLSPSAKKSLVYNFSNLDILKLENWNPTINMDWMIRNFSKELQKLSADYIESMSVVELTDLDTEIINFSTLIGEKLYQDINITFDYNKFSLMNKSTQLNGKDKYWKSGVGYGFQGRDEWDIKKYVQDQELKNKKLEKSINHIIELSIKEINVESIINSPIIKFVSNNIINSTLLEISKIPTLFVKILELTKVLFDFLGSNFDEFKINIYNSLENIRQDINPMLKSVSDEEDKLNTYISIISLTDTIKDKVSKLKLPIYEDIVFEPNLSDKDNYSKMITIEQSKIFSDFKIESNHRFSKYKSEAVNPKSLMRISSEFSSLRKNLPNNWDTSIVVRACSDNLNIFSFVITGPKDTPYHNGIYEFHAYFPKTYPNSEPKVLLDTTGNASVRFNPNLYNCGKVCLSLLGTWSGQDGESWNKSTSTFLQVLVSIQSLILVEQPYFNEPGWERQMHTNEGKMKSFNYNDLIRLENLRWAIVDKFENPPKGFEELTINHFLMKKDEIISVVNMWVDESKKYKSQMSAQRDRLIKKYQSYD